MGKNKVFCYSATGNSYHIAKMFSDDVTLIDENTEISDETENIGLIFPVYAFSIPYPVRMFIRNKIAKCNKDNIRYVFAIITSAGLPLWVQDHLERELGNIGLALSYVRTLRMPTGYLPLKKKACSDEKRDEIVRKAEKKASRYREEVRNEEIHLPGNGISYRLIGHFTNTFFPPAENDKLKVSEKCIGCGKCKKICPTKNIHFEGATAKIGGNCVSCYACYHVCPVDAISYKGAKGRYHILSEDELIQKREN